MVIRRVSEPDGNYIFNKSVASVNNWFDAEEIDESCFSVQDTLAELRADPRAGAVVEAMMVIIKDKTAGGEDIFLRGFGTFTTKERAAKVGRLIKENKSVVVPEHKIPYFKISVTIAPRTACRFMTTHIFAQIYQDFRARTARACRSHCPKVCFVAHLYNS